MPRRPTGTGTIIEVRSDLESLREIIPDWESLATSAAEPSPFYEHWMLLPALEAFGTGEGFQCVLVWDNGTLAGFFPLQPERRFHGLPVRALRTWRHRNMALTCTPLVRAKSAANVFAALLESPLAPALDFEWMPADSAVYAALVESVLARGLPWAVTDAYSRAILRREHDPRERFNSNMKNNLRRWQAKLASHGAVTPVRLAPDGDLERWTAEFMRLEASGWKGKEGTALACREDDRRFIAAIFPEAFRRGRLHITGLDLAGKPLARHCMIAGGEGALTFKIAYDETYASCSPGIVAEVDNVRQFLENDGPRWVDSNTARENTSYGRVWKDRRTFHKVAVGLRGAGKLAVAALPLLRLTKHALARVAHRQHGLNGPMKRDRIPAPQPLP